MTYTGRRIETSLTRHVQRIQLYQFQKGLQGQYALVVVSAKVSYVRVSFTLTRFACLVQIRYTDKLLPRTYCYVFLTARFSLLSDKHLFITVHV